MKDQHWQVKRNRRENRQQCKITIFPFSTSHRVRHLTRPSDVTIYVCTTFRSRCLLFNEIELPPSLDGKYLLTCLPDADIWPLNCFQKCYIRFHTGERLTASNRRKADQLFDWCRFYGFPPPMYTYSDSTQVSCSASEALARFFQLLSPT